MLATDEGQPRPRGPLRPGSDGLADIPRLHRLGLAFDRERPDLRLQEASRHLAHYVTRGIHMRRGRLAHHARGQVHGVAHDRVPASVLGSHLAGEHRPAVDADLHGQRWIGLDDLPQGKEHPFLVVPDHARRADAQANLAAVGGDVGIEEADLVALARVLDDRDEPVEPVSSRVNAVIGDDPVELAELQEGNRRRPVLGSGVAPEQMLADDRRQTARDRILVGRREILLGRPLGRRRRPRQESPGPERIADAATGQRLGGLRAEQDLPRRGGALHRDDCDAAGPAISSSRCDPPTRNIAYAPVWTPTDMRSTTSLAPARIRPTSRSVRRMAAADAQARRACSSPANHRSIASPPNFSSDPPRL